MCPHIVPGRPAPLGATPDPQGTNFAVASSGDEVTLCLFDTDGAETRLVLRERDGDVWHGFVPGVTPGQAYGFRVSGSYDPARGLRFNPAKLLLDPYAGDRRGRRGLGPGVLGHTPDNPAAPSPLDSAGHVPRSLVMAARQPPCPAESCPRRHDYLRGARKRFHRSTSGCTPSCAGRTRGWRTRPRWNTWLNSG